MTTSGISIIARAVFRPGDASPDLRFMQPIEASSFGYKAATAQLNRKGLRFKDEATLMALVAADQIIKNSPGINNALRTGVLVTSNTGNLDTVIENAKIIASSHVNDTSAMALPNASSNVVSATIAIVNELRGPNIMLCNGKAAGLDALQIALDLIKSGRADRMLVIAVEVDNPFVRALIPIDETRFHGAAGIMLERTEPFDQFANGQRAEKYIKIKQVEAVSFPVGAEEITERTGYASSAGGILQCILAAEYAEENEPRYLQHRSNNWLITR